MNNKVLKALIFAEIALVEIFIGQDHKVRHIKLSSGKIYNIKDIKKLAEKCDVDVKQALQILMSEAHSYEFYMEHSLSLHYLDTLSIAGASRRFDVFMLCPQTGKILSHAGNELDCKIRRCYNALVVR